MSEEKLLPIDKDESDDPSKNEEVLPTERDDALTDPNPTQNPSISPSDKDSSTTTSETVSTTTFVKSVWSPGRSELSDKDDGNSIPKVLELSLTGAVKSLTLDESTADLGDRDDSSNIQDLPSPVCVPLATRSIVEEIQQTQDEIIKAIKQSQQEVLAATQWSHSVPFESREELGAIGGDGQYFFGVRTSQEDQNAMREPRDDFRVMFVSREEVLNAIRRSRREILEAIRQPQEEILQAVSRLSRELNRRNLAQMEEVRGPREMMEATSGWRPQEFLDEDTLYEMWRPPKHIFDEYQEQRRQEKIDRKKQQRAFAKTMGWPDPGDEDLEEEEDEDEFSSSS